MIHFPCRFIFCFMLIPIDCAFPFPRINKIWNREPFYSCLFLYHFQSLGIKTLIGRAAIFLSFSFWSSFHIGRQSFPIIKAQGTAHTDLSFLFSNWFLSSFSSCTCLCLSSVLLFHYEFLLSFVSLQSSCTFFMPFPVLSFHLQFLDDIWVLRFLFYYQDLELSSLLLSFFSFLWNIWIALAYAILHSSFLNLESHACSLSVSAFLIHFPLEVLFLPGIHMSLKS